jgi:inorganic pyrophosphatase
MIMEDEAGRDEKILSVSDRDPRLSHIMDIKDVPPNYLKELEHFFIHIKDLEHDKWAKVEGFQDKAKGISVVREGIRNGRRE